MRYLNLLLFAILLPCSLLAQVPQAIKYQAVARDTMGQIMVNTVVKVRISITDSAAGGSAVYSEIHNAVTNQFGLFNVSIGRGTNQTGAFSNINWASGNKWMQLEMSQYNGASFQLMGVSEMLSVPYALYAETSNNAGPPGSRGVGIDTTIDNRDGTFSFHYSDGSVFTTSNLTGPQGQQGLTGPQGPPGACGLTCDSILFRAVIDTSLGHGLTAGTWNKVLFDIPELNHGSGYNNATGIFSAPRDGMYFFTAKVETDDLLLWSSNTSAAICIHNLYTQRDLDCTEGSVSVTGLHLQVNSIIELKRFEQIEVRVFVNNAGFANYRLTRDPAYNNFSGYLIR